MTDEVVVELGLRTYTIRIGSELPIGVALSGEKETTALLVSDSNVAPLYAGELSARLRENGLCVVQAVVPAGEQSKCLACAEFLYGKAVEAGLDRHSVIVALGGGMVGDLAGFVAATFLRGLRLVQIPTSLLAMVDSSVGGKTAVDLPQGKNLVGVFHQPIEVAADLATLTTLPRREYISGLGEVVKYGVIHDAALFRDLEESVDLLLERDKLTLQRMVRRCCEIKAEVVANDERESGERAILNFGHTCGHAIEQVTGYSRWLHGEAVALGMVFAAELSTEICGFPAADAERLLSLIERLELPVKIGDGESSPSWSDVRAAMAADKKTRGGVPRFVLAERLGAVNFGCEVTEDCLEQAWNRCQ